MDGRRASGSAPSAPHWMSFCQELDEATEKGILKTLASLKGKDPRIYDHDFTFFAPKVTHKLPSP